MVVCMRRRICVELYKYLRELPGCPEVAVVITGPASDPEDYQLQSYSGYFFGKHRFDSRKVFDI